MPVYDLHQTLQTLQVLDSHLHTTQAVEQYSTTVLPHSTVQPYSAVQYNTVVCEYRSLVNSQVKIIRDIIDLFSFIALAANVISTYPTNIQDDLLSLIVLTNENILTVKKYQTTVVGE